MSRTPVHLLKVHVHCVPRHYLFLEGVFLLFLQLFLITSFGHYIPKKLWQRQRCKEGRDKVLVRTILDTVFREREFIHVELPIYYCVMTKEKKIGGYKAKQTLFESWHCIIVTSLVAWGKSLN